MKEPIDAAVRAEALDHRRSFIVQAPAGSGKTELLTRRILNLLAKVEKPEEVLAITFTRKAASEMRQRVIEVLENAAADVPVTDAHEQQGRRLAETVLQRSQELGWDLLDNPGRLQLQTIDSFCAVLTRQLPVTSAFGGVLSVAEDASPLYLQAAERCIARGLQAGEVGAEALEVLLSHLDTNLDRLQTLMKDMLSNRDQWLRHYHRVLDSRKEMEDALFALIDDRFSAFAAVVPQDLNEACLPLLQHASSCTAGLGTRNQFNSLDGLKAFPAPSRDNALFWRDIANLLLTNDGGFRKRIDRNAGFPTNDKDAKVLGLDALYLREKSDSVKSLIGSLSDDENFRLRLQEIRTLPAGGYSDQQWQVMESLIELMLLCVAELHLVFSDEATVDYAEISIRASNALGALDEPTDLALAMDYRLRHILVDEFQDTSISQFALFEKLLDGWEPDDGRTFFAVGDPMQSIYLFRDAEVGLFLQASADGIGPVQLEPLQLECNFRSDPVLVDWSNKVFSSIFPAEETIATGAISYASSTPFRDSATGSGQFTHTILSNDRKREAECVVELVEAALASDDPPDSLAILVRSKMNLAMVFPKLQAKGIDYQAIDIETLGDRLVVKDILSMLRALQHPLDRISWLSLLRAPFCGLTLTDLHTLVADNSDEPIWSLLTSEAWKKELSEDGKARLERLMGVMAKAVNRAVKDGLVSWLEASWLALGGPASCQTEADLLAADACFTELGRIEEIGRLWDPVFVNGQMKRLFAPAGSATAVVQMMTIHKSKGLEFDTVILPGLARPARADQSQLLNWFECRSDDGESRLLMAPVTEKGAEQGSSEPILDFVKSFRAEKSGNELLRLLYVAATRARRNLHLVTHAVEDGDSLKLPVKSSLAYPLWLELTRGFQSTEASDSQEILDEPEPPAMIRIKSGWTVPDLSGDWPEDFSPVDTELLEAETLEFEWAGQVARLTGSLVHRQIQRIVDEGLDQWSVERVQSCREFYRTHLTAQGVASESLENAIQTVVTAMTNLVTDEKARWLLNPAHRNSVSEYRITGLVQGSLVNGIIDRMFVDESGQRWIVDFKTGSHLGADAAGFLDREQLRYKPQLERYAAVVSSLESEPVRLGLYFTLLKGWREWQPNLDK